MSREAKEIRCYVVRSSVARNDNREIHVTRWVMGILFGYWNVLSDDELSFSRRTDCYQKYRAIILCDMWDLVYLFVATIKLQANSRCLN